MLRSTIARVLTASGAGSAAVGTSVAFTAMSMVSPSAESPYDVTSGDTTTGTALTCPSAEFTGAVTSGGSAGTPPATGSSFRPRHCRSGGGPLAFDVIGSGALALSVSDATSGVATGTTSNVRAHAVTPNGPTCSFDVGANTGSFMSSATSTVSPGTLPSRYTDSVQQLAVPPTKPGSLGLWNVHGSGTNTYCVSPSILQQGDQLSIAVTFEIGADVAADNPIAVT